MPVAFPPNPTVGQLYTFAGVTWMWNGTAWVNANAGTNFLPLSGGSLAGPGNLAVAGTLGVTGAATLDGTTASTLAVTGASTLSRPTNIQGVVDGSNAPAGDVGEFLTFAFNTGVSLSNNTWISVGGALLTLTPGDWDVWGMVSYGFTGGLGAAFYVALSNVLNGTPLNQNVASLTVPHSGAGLVAPLQRMNLTASLPLYLNCYATLGAATGCSVNPGSVSARRVR